jgi:hypothetical protein
MHTYSSEMPLTVGNFRMFNTPGARKLTPGVIVEVWGYDYCSHDLHAC